MTQRAIFITGAAAGIGRATAQLFSARGWFVGLYDVSADAIEALRDELGRARSCGGRLDVVDAEAFAAALRSFVEHSGGRLDVMFNCAGILSTGSFDSIPLARHHQLVDVNFKGTLNGAHAALPHLRATPGACLINMASASAIYGPPAFASYGATKFAVKGLTEALNIEWSREGIRVMDVLPLFVATPMVRDVAAPPKSIGRLGVNLTAEDIARTVWRAAHARSGSRVHWYPGLQTQALALSNKLMPAFLNRLSTKLVSGY